ncbi:polycystic kidney disease protein 1-like 2 [Patella vulgata]|uniref:polycystic kidney disease protein 1-like 2 n=1 Tax=Patella vulgata TaxID=6465 RepID=UPI0024A9F80E|nr:polycystic kidney disease protein 1-like 2 [Patella vulgata]
MDLRNNRTACLCQNPTNQEITASSFFVPPNSIDFSTVFSKFDIKSQAAVLAVIIIITLIAILAGIWGHWKDRQDKLQWGVTVLADNYKDDSYFYLVTVYTGLVRGGGTTSNISFNLSGERDDSGVRTLTDGVRKEFSAGSVMHFLMAVPTSLGSLQCFRVWHDNSGNGRHASWYLSRIEIHDIQTNDRYDFMCSDWLSVEDGHIERLVPVSGRINFNNFKTMFYEHARSHVTDDHLWLSVFLRPVKSHFYRVQRIGCCYALLMLTMIANAMFFEGKDQKDRQQLSQIELGPIRFSLNQLYISNRLEEALVVRDIVDDKEGVLPHFCVYIAWVIIFIAAFVSAFFLMLFSMEWGKSLSEEWLTSFFLSFLQSMVVVDPFKVVFMAVVFSLFLKAIKSSSPTHYDLKEITLLANKKGQPNAGRRRLKFAMPYSEEEFQRLKLQRVRNVRRNQSVKELCFNSVFLWILFSISYSNRDQQSYLLHQYVQNNFMEPPKPYRTYEKIGEAAHFFDWLNSTVLPTLFTEDDYRGYRMVSSQRLFSYDTNNFRVGPPRLRQVRTKKTTCDIPYVGNTECILGYQLPIEDTDTYCMGWTSTPCPDFEKLALTYEAYKFTSALDIWGYPIAGQHNVYGGGGYIANLDVNMLISFESLKELFNSKWIDRNTRAVFFEYTLYNVNKNIFVYVSMLTEFPETGGTITFSNIYPFRPSQHEGAHAAYVLLCELAFCVYIVINVIIIIIKMAKQKLRYFKQFWQVIDLIMIGIAIAAIALYAVREGFTADALQKYRDNNREFVNFYHVAIWDGTFVAFLGFLVAIATVRLIKALGYTRRTAKIYNVLKNSSKVLPGLAFYIVTVLTSFSFWGLICFGSISERYYSFITCLETLFMAILGSPDFKETGAEIQDTWITILYFCLFVVMVTLTLTTIFLAIMLDVMAMTQGSEPNESDIDMELISYVWQSFLGIFTGRKPDMKGNQRMTNVMTAARLAQENNRKPQGSEDGENDIPYLISRSNSVRSLKPVTNIKGRIVYQ